MNNATLKNPAVVTIPNPVGIDVAIKAIQVSLGTLPWLQKSFGRAWTLPTNHPNGQKVLEPKVYQGTNEYYPVLPNDALQSYSFFRCMNARSTTDYAPNMNPGGKVHFDDPVDLIVWCDLKSIDPSKDWIFKEELIHDVLKKLNVNPDIHVIRVWDDKVDDIYKGYTLLTSHRDLLMYPYTAFRIEMNLSYHFECQP